MDHIEKRHYGVAGTVDLIIFCVCIGLYLFVLSHPDFLDAKHPKPAESSMLMSSFEQVRN